MSVTWVKAEARADAEPKPPTAPNGATAPEVPRLIVVDSFLPSMIDMNASGARVHIKPIARYDAQSLVAREKPPTFHASARTWEIDQLEHELGVGLARPQLRYGTQMLVMQRMGRDTRFFLVTYESDGEGVVE